MPVALPYAVRSWTPARAGLPLARDARPDVDRMARYLDELRGADVPDRREIERAWAELSRMARSPRPEVRRDVASLDLTPRVLLLALAMDADASVRAVALANPKTEPTRRILESAARADDASVRVHAAVDTRTPKDALAALLRDADASVAAAAASNDSTRVLDLLDAPLHLVPGDRLEEVIEHQGSSAVRRSREAAMTLVGALADDRRLSVRQALETVDAALR